jgi:hypothetical protein
MAANGRQWPPMDFWAPVGDPPPTANWDWSSTVHRQGVKESQMGARRLGQRPASTYADHGRPCPTMADYGPGPADYHRCLPTRHPMPPQAGERAPHAFHSS